VSARDAVLEDVFCAELNGKSFVLYNNQPLSDEPVSDEDIFYCTAHGEKMKKAQSEAWSANAQWFFVILDAGIILVNAATMRGVLCRKKSFRFIEAYLDAPGRFGK
jgi:hypothetical protein